MGVKGDIFVRFGGTVLGRVLAELGVDDLLAVGGVSKRWRRSMTLSKSSEIVCSPLPNPFRKGEARFQDLCPSSKLVT